MLLEFSGAIGHKGKFLCLSHYHGTSGLAQTCKESVDTTVVLILNPCTATPNMFPTARHSHQLSKSPTDACFYSLCLLMVGSYTDTDEVTFVERATTAPTPLTQVTIDSQSLSVERCLVHILSRKRCEYRSSILASFFCFASPLRPFLLELTLSCRCALF